MTLLQAPADLDLDLQAGAARDGLPGLDLDLALWDTSCPDWAERLLAGRPLVPDIPELQVEPYKSQVAYALRVFKRLRLADVHGNPTMGEAGADWVFAIVAVLLGSYDPATHVRMVNEVFALVPKGNSKSTYFALAMLTANIINLRPRGEFMFIAPTMKIADTAFNQVDGAIALDDKLDKLFHRQRHLRTITNRNTDAALQIKAADTDTITGGKAVGTLLDETHEFALKARAQEIFVELRGSLSKRPDGFFAQITTQSKAPPTGVFKEELARARAVRDGTLRARLLPVLYELPEALLEAEAWRDRRYWPLLNPNLGRSVHPPYIAEQLALAEQEGPHKLALIASQHLNVEIGVGLKTDRWAGAEFWQAAADKTLTLESLLDRSEVVTVGIDGGGLDDLLGLSVVGREPKSRRWLSWSHAWAHDTVLTRRKSIAPMLRSLADAGEVTIVERLGADIEGLVALVELCERLLAGVGLDPQGVGAVVDALADAGIGERDDDRRVTGVRQGYTLTGPIKTTERKLVDGSLVHADQALMNWAVGNARVEQKGNAIVITKQASGTAKIDPLMALFNAVALMSTNPANRVSVYRTRGLLVA